MKKVLAIAAAAWIGSQFGPSYSTAYAQEDTSGDSYAMQPGDSLLEVGLFYSVTTDELSAMNNLESPFLAASGSTLVVPFPANSTVVDTSATGGPYEESAVTPDEVPTQTVEVAANPGYHLIQPGDTLFRIATRYGVSMQALAYVNDIVTPDTIYVGQQLKIPDGSEVIPDEPERPAPVPPLDADPLSGTGGAYAGWDAGKQIVVDLSDQTTYAYENGNLLGQFVVSTGLPGTPTVLGDYSIYIKLESQRMVGPDYDLPGVPWVMYFYQGYGLHGTYWHNNFGHPMSHGCVNMRTGDAEWMYSWAPMGTPVHVIP